MEDQISRVESDTPLDPTQINIISKEVRLIEIIDLMAQGGITPQPSVEWSPDQQSRLIESIMVRIPIQAIYVDGMDSTHWTIIDGHNRLDAIKTYVVDKTLALSGLEFLHHLRGKKYDELDRQMQRRISECLIQVHKITPGVPDHIKASIVERIRSMQR